MLSNKDQDKRGLWGKPLLKFLKKSYTNQHEKTQIKNAALQSNCLGSPSQFKQESKTKRVQKIKRKTGNLKIDKNRIYYQFFRYQD